MNSGRSRVLEHPESDMALGDFKSIALSELFPSAFSELFPSAFSELLPNASSKLFPNKNIARWGSCAGGET